MFMDRVEAAFRPPTHNLRRSPRLQENGYYGPDGKPTVSYKETLYKVFKSRKRRRARLSSKQRSLNENDYQLDVRKSIPEKASRYCYCMGLILLMALAALFGLYPGWFFGFLGSAPNTSISPDKEVFNFGSVVSEEADRMSNFALLNDGAQVLTEHSSDTYWPPNWLHRYQAWRCPKQPFILCPRSPLTPGVCWPFAGDSGHVHIKLTKSVHLSHVTLGHITKEQSPNGFTTSAPRDFVVYGMEKETGERSYLGQFQYDSDGPAFQTFALQNFMEAFGHVQIEVLNNGGNKDFTCLYGIRVHGSPGAKT